MTHLGDVAFVDGNVAAIVANAATTGTSSQALFQYLCRLTGARERDDVVFGAVHQQEPFRKMKIRRRNRCCWRQQQLFSRALVHFVERPDQFVLDLPGGGVLCEIISVVSVGRFEGRDFLDTASSLVVEVVPDVVDAGNPDEGVDTSPFVGKIIWLASSNLRNLFLDPFDHPQHRNVATGGMPHDDRSQVGKMMGVLAIGLLLVVFSFHEASFHEAILEILVAPLGVFLRQFPKGGFQVVDLRLRLSLRFRLLVFLCSSLYSSVALNTAFKILSSNSLLSSRTTSGSSSN